jgi:hypothetical protein
LAVGVEARDGRVKIRALEADTPAALSEPVARDPAGVDAVADLLVGFRRRGDLGDSQELVGVRRLRERAFRMMTYGYRGARNRSPG